ncbi:MAG: potassium channel family protein [Chitinophagales bacterium]
MKTANPFFRLYLSLGVFFIILLTGTIGYMLLEGYQPLEALYMCVITVASVGFNEVHPLSDAGRIFTIFLILANFATLGFIVSTLTRYLLDGEFIDSYKRFTMENKIDSLSGHVIVCGYGRNGSEAVSRMLKAGRQVVVVEKHIHDRDLRDLPFFMEGDATKDEVLLQAGIQRAAALICTLPDDSENVFIVLTARELNRDLKIISRASKDSSLSKLKTAGANNVIMPDKIGGSHMASLLISPDVKEFLDMMGSVNDEHFMISELEAQKTILLQNLPVTGATILGLKRAEGYRLNPSNDSEIVPGNKLIAMGSKAQLAHLRQSIE